MIHFSLGFMFKISSPGVEFDKVLYGKKGGFSGGPWISRGPYVGLVDQVSDQG